MITVHYKPFEALRPVHIAVLAAAEANLVQGKLPAMLGLPPLILQHATEDLMRWGLVALNGSTVELLTRGTRCVSVWVATGQHGFWSFPNPAEWMLGKGVFSFRTPILRLGDAGFNPDTGGSISQENKELAINAQRNLLHKTKQLEHEIQDGTISKWLATRPESGEAPEETVATLLGRPKTRLHLNQICRLLDSALADSLPDAPNTRTLQNRARQAIEKERERAERRLRDEQRTMQLVQEFLLAVWLSNQAGLLRELADVDPCSILIRSDSEAVWPTEKKPIRTIPKEVPKNESGSILDELNRFISSWFK